MSIEALWKDYLGKRKERGPTPAYDANAYDELRRAAYRRMFGRSPLHVLMEPVPTPPFQVLVDIYEPPAVAISFAGASPEYTRPFTTLATTGMSNERQADPKDVHPPEVRVELAAYVSPAAIAAQPDLEHFLGDVLLCYAKMPFLSNQTIRPGKLAPVCTIGQGLVRFLGDDGVAGFMFLPPPESFEESQAYRTLRLDGDPVRFFGLVPLTRSELSFATIVGVDNFLETCPEIPFVYGGPRASMI